jgi:hypothetical protein
LAITRSFSSINDGGVPTGSVIAVLNFRCAGASTSNAGQEVSGLGQHRLGRDDRAGPVGEGATAPQVLGLAAVEK